MKAKTDTALKGADNNFDTSKLIVLTLASTCLRIFLPSLGLFGIGALIDFNFDSKPWGMLIGVSVGMIIAVILVGLQIRSIKKEQRK